MSQSFVELGSIAKFINGAAFKPEDWGESGLRIIRIQNLTDLNKPFNRTERIVSDSMKVQHGDLLVSWSATLGVYEWNDSNEALLNQHIFRVLPDEIKVDKRYLRHGLEGAIIDMQQHLHGATMQHVNRGEFLKTKLYLPPIDQQKRIAAILDKAEELRRLRRQSIEHLDVLSRSIFIEMFGDPVTNPKGWDRVMFSDLLLKIESGHSPNCLDRPVIEDKEWGVLKLGAITSCKYNPLENKALPPNEKPHLELEVKVGDLLFTRKNTYELVAACALVLTTIPNLLLPDLIFRFRLKLDAPMNSSFLHQLLINPAKRREIQKLASGSSSSMPNISKAKLQSILIEVPPLSLQQEFAQRIEAIESLKAKHRESLTHLDTLFASLQHRAFRGEL